MSAANSLPETVSDAPPVVQNYQRLNPLALAGLLLGLLSVLAPTSPLLWPAPILAIGCCGVALWQIRRRPEDWSGGRAATIGLIFAALFLGLATGRYYSRRSYLFHRARSHADEWFDLFRQGKLQQAHQLRLIKVNRAGPSLPLEELYAADADLASDLRQFLDSYPVFHLRDHLNEGRLTFEGNGGIRYGPFEEIMTLNYRLQYQDELGDRNIGLRVEMRRKLDPRTFEYSWNVFEISDDKGVFEAPLPEETSGY